MSDKDIFVTGTDTDIGKTIVSTILALGLRRTYWKPIQSGLAQLTDTEFVQKFVDIENIHPEVYRLNSPLSPHISAQIDGIKIKTKKIVESRPVDRGPLVIEGAGGVCVPINEEHMIIDLILELKVPTLLVAKSGLGTLNHTFLTLEALRSRGIEVLGVALVGPKNQSNRESIERYGQSPVLLEVENIEVFSSQKFLDVFEESEINQRKELWN